MPLKATKALEDVKGNTVVSTYLTGAAVAPEVGHLSIYVDLLSEDQHREVEIRERLADLISRAREEDYLRPTVITTVYYRMNLNESRADITSTVLNTDIVEGDVAIGISAEVVVGGRGSLLIDSCFREIVDFMGETNQLAG